MKILRSKGQSFTTGPDEPRKENEPPLSRGLRVDAPSDVEAALIKVSDPSIPAQLPAYLQRDHDLVLRQIVSVMDKVLRKPRSLRFGDLMSTYVDRTHLSVALWNLFRERLGADIPGGAAELDRLEKSWRWKVHPYAQKPVDFQRPERDGNADIIRARQSGTGAGANPLQSWKREGRWYDALWKTTDEGYPDYTATANAIFNHLWDQEVEIDGDPRKNHGDDGEPTGTGLAGNRGESIAASANDPRIPRDKNKTLTWGAETEELYFQQDIAQKIYAATAILSAESAALSLASHFGCLLYAHFPDVKKACDDHELPTSDLWNLHNTVRQFYKKLSQSAGFRMAIAGKELLSRHLPPDKDALLRILRAKDRNKDISHLIRLGKLIVHASNIPDAPKADPDPVFQQRMNWLATSAGQAEIKRNETFTRVWRNAVGLSLRTLKAWADPQGTAGVPLPGGRASTDQDCDEDLASVAVSKKAVWGQTTFSPKHYERHVGLIFGHRPVAACEGSSRAALFDTADVSQQKEVLWALLRLAGELRHRTNHFSLRSRLVQALTAPLLTEATENQLRNIGERPGKCVHPDALARFDKLLAFDRAMLGQALLDELTSLQVNRYLTADQIKGIFTELDPVPVGLPFPPPKFMAVLKRVAAVNAGNPGRLAPVLKPFVSLALDSLSKQPQDANLCRIGLLRQLYQAGFPAWLADRLSDANFLRDTIAEVIKARNARAEDFHEGRVYALAESLASGRGLERCRDAADLFQRLTALAMSEGRINESYQPKRSDQSTSASWIEAFKQELFAHFFGNYLAGRNLAWITEIGELPTPGAPLTLEELPSTPVKWDELQPWHAQFYAWLHLLPIDDVSLLRHQFIKTAALDQPEKTPCAAPADPAEAAAQAVPRTLDKLMALYIRVHSAGFAGNEHMVGGDPVASGGWEVLYKGSGLFEPKDGPQGEARQTSFPGTRRGIRHMLRFGSLTVLKGIFERHRVTSAEINDVQKWSDATVKKKFDQRHKLHAEIIRMDKTKADEHGLRALCAQYKEVAVETTLYNFQVNAIRLTEFARLHQLLMRIVGRLADFTLTWERDRIYLFLGMLADQITAGGGTLQLIQKETRLGLKLSDKQIEALQKQTIPNDSRFAKLREDVAVGFLSLWRDGWGFDMNAFWLFMELLDEKNREIFKRYFVGTDANQRDLDNNAQRKQKGQMVRRLDNSRGKTQIRNDFAHYNVLRKPTANLTYWVNAVRGLLAYDRKLKNAVIPAITDILRDDDLTITWTFAEDRLTHALVEPAIETHLDMLRNPKLRQACGFSLPQASVRYTSMVQALFSHGLGGHRTLVGMGRAAKHTGQLTYPASLLQRDGNGIPAAMRVILPAI